jgi:hypothetical protein
VNWFSLPMDSAVKRMRHEHLPSLFYAGLGQPSRGNDPGGRQSGTFLLCHAPAVSGLPMYFR